MEEIESAVKLEHFIGILRPVFVVAFSAMDVIVFAHYVGRIIITNAEAALNILSLLFSITLTLAIYIIFNSYTLLEDARDVVYLYLRMIATVGFEFIVYKALNGEEIFLRISVYQAVAFAALYFVYPKSDPDVLVALLEALNSELAEGRIEKSTYERALSALREMLPTMKYAGPIRRLGVVFLLTLAISRIPAFFVFYGASIKAALVVVALILSAFMIYEATLIEKLSSVRTARAIALVYSIRKKHEKERY